MTLPRPLFACPGCSRPFVPEEACPACGAQVSVDRTILDFLGSGDRTAEAREVEAFYERRPFPGYAPGDDAQTLLDRSRRSPFLVSLDRSIPPDAAVLDCGAGTSQLATFLALAAPRRTVVAVDGCRASLAAAAGFRARAKIDNLRLVRGDLFALPVLPSAFDVVICRGVVHHTPDPVRATNEVARRVAPGGFIVLGFYENVARGFHRARRVLARATGGRPIRFLDPVLRRADLDPEKKEVWIADQYEHPLELMLPFPEVWHWLESQGFEWVRSVPPAPDADGIFDVTPEPSAVGLWMRRMGWCLAGFNDEDAGLVAVVARRRQEHG
jgi:SAM-dependent methyltransferase